jgi:hypothetical protein
MEGDEEKSIFDGLEEKKKNRPMQILRAVLIIVLFIVSLFFCLVSWYFFYVTANLPNIKEIYGNNMINQTTIGYLVLFFSALITILLGVFFVIQKKWRRTLVILFAGNVLSWLISLYI